MPKKEKYQELSKSIMNLVGGKENIEFFTHCVTRLRFNLKNKDVVDLEKINEIEGVLGSQWSGDQLQIIIGQGVSDAYNLIYNKYDLNSEKALDENLDAKGSKEKFSLLSILDAISGSITPVIPVLIGCGMIKVIVLLGEMLGILTKGQSTDTVLTFVGDAGFYFLPILIGANTAKKFGGNVALGSLMGAIFLHPTFITALTKGTALSIFQIPIYNTTYSSTIFPALLTVWVMCYVEKFIAKHSPEAIRALVEPLFTILIMLPIALCLLGPAGAFLGNYIAAAVMGIYHIFGFLAIGLLAAIFPWLILTGMHAGFTPYLLNAFATVGYDPIVITANVITNVNQGAASLAVAFKTKNKTLRSTAISSGITAIVGGVTEPAMFGVNFKLRKPLYAVMIGSFVGGCLAGFGKAAAYAFVGSGGIFAIPAYINEKLSNVIYIVISMILGMIVTFVVTLIIYKDENS